jgi:hypothetical protein
MPVLNREYKPKSCIVCGEEFTPRSGVQKACSDACKAEARAKGLKLRRSKADSEAIEAPETDIKAEVARALGVAPREVSGFAPKSNGHASHREPSRRRKPSARKDSARDGSDSAGEIPDLELDLSPMAEYIKAVVKQAVKEEMQAAFKQLLK